MDVVDEADVAKEVLVADVVDVMFEGAVADEVLGCLTAEWSAPGGSRRADILVDQGVLGHGALIAFW